MAKRRRIQLVPPLGGLDTSGSYRNQPPYTTPEAINVWPTETAEGRQRIGTRAGIGPAFVDQLGEVGNRPVRMLAPLTVVGSDGFTFWQDLFEGVDLSSSWESATWTGAGALPGIYSSATVDYTTGVDAVSKDIAIDSTSPYVAEIFIQPFGGEHHGEYRIYAAMDDTTPDITTDGMKLSLTMLGSDGTWSGTLKTYNAGAETSYALTAGVADLGAAMPGWLSLVVDGTSVTVYWNRTLILTQTVTLGAGAGTRWGFGMTCSTAGGVTMVNQARLQYYEETPQERRRTMLVASAAGNLYAETGPINRLTQITTDLTLNDSTPLQAAQRTQKLYIADHGDVIIDASASVAGTALTVDGVLTTNVNTDDFVVYLSNCLGSAVEDTYTIAAVADGVLTLSTSAGTGGCKARVERCPKVYDPAAGTFALLTASSGLGQVPLGSETICLYNDRLCMAKDHVCYQSRQGDPTDWDYGADTGDVGRAVATTASDSNTGQIGDVIIALIPHSDDYLIMGCTNSLWMQIGDIAYGGRIENLTYDAGVIHRNAWCRGPDGVVVVLSWDGLYVLAPGSTQPPTNISRKVMPRELMDIDTTIYDVAMAFDFRFQGIMISLVPKGESTGRRSYWFDWHNKGFWPMLVPEGLETACMTTHHSIAASDSAVLFGCRDGYVRRLRDEYETDEGTDLGALVDIGPFRIWDDMTTGLFSELQGNLAADSNDVTWAVRVGNSNEEAVKASTNHMSATWGQGYNEIGYPYASGWSAVVRLSTGETGKRWSVENMAATCEIFGEMHRL